MRDLSGSGKLNRPCLSWTCMQPTAKRWARLGRDNPSTMFHTPENGVCLSTFIVARRGNSALVGRPKDHRAWPEKGGLPQGRAADLDKQGAWLLPATHLLMDESPDHAARRIVREWTGLQGTPRFVEVQSHVRPGRLLRAGAKGNHWDFCFVYELRARALPRLRPWWSEMKFVPFSEIPDMNLGRGHADILEEAGYLRPRGRR